MIKEHGSELDHSALKALIPWSEIQLIYYLVTT